MTLSCRFYKKRLPDIDENVMVIVKQIGDVGVDVQLLEYGHRPGLSRARRLDVVINSVSRDDSVEGIIAASYSLDPRFSSSEPRRSGIGDTDRSRERSASHSVHSFGETLVHLGYIDLSKRQVSPEEQAECQEKFARGKTVRDSVVIVEEDLFLLRLGAQHPSSYCRSGRNR